MYKMHLSCIIYYLHVSVAVATTIRGTFTRIPIKYTT